MGDMMVLVWLARCEVLRGKKRVAKHFQLGRGASGGISSKPNSKLELERGRAAELLRPNRLLI